jgi:hypothetical protein
MPRSSSALVAAAAPTRTPRRGARQVDHEGAEREVAADPCRDRGADAVPRHGPEPAENGHAEVGEDAYRRASLTPTTATTMPAARLVSG